MQLQIVRLTRQQVLLSQVSHYALMIAKALNSASAVALGAEDFKDNKAECSETSNDGTTAVYACKAQGFEGVNEATVTIDVASKSVKEYRSNKV